MSSTRYDTQQAADYIGMSKAFLDRRRTKGDGPSFLKIGGRVYYMEADLDKWLAGRRRNSTSEYQGVAA